MSNREYYEGWLLNIINRMSTIEFARFLLAFLAGYGGEDGVNFSCYEICGKETPDPNGCPFDCEKETERFMMEEHR